MTDEHNQRQLVDSIKRQINDLVNDDRQEIDGTDQQDLIGQLQEWTDQAHENGLIETETKASIDKQIQEFSTYGMTETAVGVLTRLREAIEQ